MVGILQGVWTKIFKYVTLWNNHDCYLRTDKYVTSLLNAYSFWHQFFLRMASWYEHWAANSIWTVGFIMIRFKPYLFSLFQQRDYQYNQVWGLLLKKCNHTEKAERERIKLNFGMSSLCCVSVQGQQTDRFLHPQALHDAVWQSLI